MRILIIGSAGQIGGALYDALRKHKGWRVWGADIARGKRSTVALDITKRIQVYSQIKKIRPDIVILTAAMTNVDDCERKKSRARKINVQGVQYVAEACKDQRAKLIFFSSAYVFDGKAGNYSEKDIPRPINYYGKTKLEAERIIHKTLNDYIVIRTTWVFANSDFLVERFRALRKGETLPIANDQWGNPTSADNISEAVEEMIERNCKGLWHIGGPDKMNKYDWTVLQAKHRKLRFSLIKSTATNGEKTRRPLQGTLSVRKAQKYLHTQLYFPRV